MTDYDNTNRGALFKNDRKESESHPDYKGTLNVNGTEFWLSAWLKEGRKGKFMSVSVNPKDTPKQGAAKAKAAASAVDELDDDIPFDRGH